MYDTPHHHNSPPLNQFPEYQEGNGNYVGMIPNVNGVKRNNIGAEMKASDFINSPMNTYPMCTRLYSCLPPGKQLLSTNHALLPLLFGSLPNRRCLPLNFFRPGEAPPGWKAICPLGIFQA